MSNRVRPRAVVEDVYGFPFPDDLYAVSDFAKANPSVLEVLDVALDGPFALISGAKKGVGKGWDPGGDWPRFYNDPPEFFTIAIGHGFSARERRNDALHWGYWFDDPSTMPPVVASYCHNDALSIGVDGTSLFEALRAHVESLVQDAEEFATRREAPHSRPKAKGEPDEAEDYATRIAALGRAREALGAYALADRRETGSAYLERYVDTKQPRTSRKPIAATRNGMGIVVPKKEYRPLLSEDPFQAVTYKPKPKDVQAWVAEAKEAIHDGCPGLALKLGHDLWTYSAFASESYELLDRAYAALGRKVLRDYLKRAVAFRKRCAASR